LSTLAFHINGIISFVIFFSFFFSTGV
jgi:hypothetical protein